MHKHEAGVSRFFIYTVSALYKISGTGCNKYKTRHTNISTPSRTPRSTVGSYAPTVARNSYHLRAPRDHIQSIDPPANRPGNTRLGSRASGSTRAPRPMTRPELPARGACGPSPHMPPAGRCGLCCLVSHPHQASDHPTCAMAPGPSHLRSRSSHRSSGPTHPQIACLAATSTRNPHRHRTHRHREQNIHRSSQ